MRVDFLDNFSLSGCRTYGWFLASIWSFGLLCGISFSYFCRFFSDTLMFASVSYCVSIIGLLISNFVPLILVTVAALFSLRGLAVLVSFCRAVMTGFCIFCVVFTYGDCGWIICLLLMFSSNWVNAMTLWLSLNIKKSKLNDLLGRITVSLTGCGVVSLVDYVFISPFLVNTLKLH